MAADDVKQLSLIKTTGQSLLSLFFQLGGVVAGLIVASSLGLFSREPWIIALYPGILSMRGVVGGLFSGRLTTGLHLGAIKGNLFGKEARSLRSLWASIIVLTFESATVLGLAALLLGTVYWGIGITDWLIIFATIVATMGISLLLISPITIAIALFSFGKGLDPDIIVYPVTATVADILVTLSYTLVLSVSFVAEATNFVLAVCVAFAAAAFLISYMNRAKVQFTKTLREATVTMIFVAFIVSITGSVLSQISGTLARSTRVAPSRLYTIYTALIGTMGGFGAIVGSTATTKLALGTIDSSFRAIKDHRNQIFGAWSASMIIYMILALISSLLTLPSNNLEALQFLTALLATNVFAALSMACIAFSVAILTFHRGLDPDNFVIPIESAVADAATTIFLLLTLSLIG